MPCLGKLSPQHQSLRLAFDDVAAAGWSAWVGFRRLLQALHQGSSTSIVLATHHRLPGPADSFVAALLQRASISGQEAEGMLLGEGGLDPVAAEQLRRGMEERVARASEGRMEPQQLEGYGQEVGLRPLVCRPNAAGDGTAVPAAVGWGSASVLPQ